MSTATVDVTIPVSGMTCASCANHVRKALEAQPGVTASNVNLTTREASVSFQPDETTVEALAEAIRSRGYGAEVPGPAGSPAEEQAAQEQAQIAEYQELRHKASIAGAIGVLAMLLSMPLMSAHSHGAAHDPLLGRIMQLVDAPVQAAMPWLYRMDADVLRYLLLGLTALVMGWAGRHFYTRAWSAFRHRVADMNTLIAVGSSAAFLYSLAATLAPGFFTSRGLAPDVYFEAIVMIIALVLAGGAMETRARGRTSAALRGLLSLQPATARLVRGSHEADVPVEHVRAGDRIRVRPGERVPVDGLVLEGTGTVDESMLTGEPIPVSKSPGDKLTGGTLNRSGSLLSEVTATGPATRLAQIVKLMRQAQASRAPMQKLADRVSGIFVPVVISIAIVTFAAWMLLAPNAGMVPALSAAVAVLIIACPCAVGLAVPTAVTMAIGRGAAMGVLFKGGDAIEKLSTVDSLLLDKTGTITQGKPTVGSVDALAGFDSAELLASAAAVERHSEHPLADAVVNEALHRNIAIPKATGFRAVPGLGASAQVGGHTVLAGNEGWLRQNGVDASALADIAAQAAREGETPILLAVDGVAAGMIAVTDPVKDTSVAAIRDLNSLGLRLTMVTGDRLETAQSIARRVGIENVAAGVSPEGKVEQVKRLQGQGHRIAMAGDGVNDAPALAQAHAGLAMATGADIAAEASDVTLMRSDLAAIADAIRLSRRAMRIMRQNLVWAFLFNAIGIPIAAGVLYPVTGTLLSPILASAAMAFSSVTVIGNSLRLGR